MFFQKIFRREHLPANITFPLFIGNVRTTTNIIVDFVDFDIDFNVCRLRRQNRTRRVTENNVLLQNVDLRIDTPVLRMDHPQMHHERPLHLERLAAKMAHVLDHFDVLVHVVDQLLVHLQYVFAQKVKATYVATLRKAFPTLAGTTPDRIVRYSYERERADVEYGRFRLLVIGDFSVDLLVFGPLAGLDAFCWFCPVVSDCAVAEEVDGQLVEAHKSLVADGTCQTIGGHLYKTDS